MVPIPFLLFVGWTAIYSSQISLCALNKRGGLNKDEAYKLASYLCNVAGSAFDVVIEVFWSNPWLNRVLLPCFLQISKVFVHDDSLNFLYSPVIPCSQLSYSDHSAGPIIK